MQQLSQNVQQNSDLHVHKVFCQQMTHSLNKRLSEPLHKHTKTCLSLTLLQVAAACGG